MYTCEIPSNSDRASRFQATSTFVSISPFLPCPSTAREYCFQEHNLVPVILPFSPHFRHYDRKVQDDTCHPFSVFVHAPDVLALHSITHLPGKANSDLLLFGVFFWYGSDKPCFMILKFAQGRLAAFSPRSHLHLQQLEDRNAYVTFPGCKTRSVPLPRL